MNSTKIFKPLKEVFTDPNYAWDLLQAEVRLQTSDAESISGEDISALLQLYMRGVERMNTLIDIRESFFKNKVTTLMSRPTVIKILNKPMTKKSQPAQAVCASPKLEQNKGVKNQSLKNVEIPTKILDSAAQLRLKQKKQSLQMRLAYSAQQNNPDALKKIIAEHSQKETIITEKIGKIVDSHQQRLKKRISERKMKTMTAKTKSQAFPEGEGVDQGIVGDLDKQNSGGIDIKFNGITINSDLIKQQRGQSEKIKKFEVQNSNKQKIPQKLIQKNRKIRRCSSLNINKFFLVDKKSEQEAERWLGWELQSPSKRKISVQMGELNKINQGEEKTAQITKYIKTTKQKETMLNQKSEKSK